MGTSSATKPRDFRLKQKEQLEIYISRRKVRRLCEAPLAVLEGTYFDKSTGYSQLDFKAFICPSRNRYIY